MSISAFMNVAMFSRSENAENVLEDLDSGSGTFKWLKE
jgi:hypothetical protein